jgi:hypothetical protein
MLNRLPQSALAALLLCGVASAADAPDGAVAAFSSPAPINLGGAGHFVILSKSGITDVPTSSVVGNIGTSPITGGADHLSCTEVTGTVYSVDAAGPAPCSIKAPATLTNAIEDMQTAYTNAAGRRPDVSELGGGAIGGLILAPGVYKWTTNVTISKNVELAGGSHAVWIFQISKNLILGNGMAVVLRGFAQSQNVYWQVAGRVEMGTTSHFEGVVLSKTAIAMKTGASVNGRLLAQTAVTLQMNRIVTP